MGLQTNLVVSEPLELNSFKASSAWFVCITNKFEQNFKADLFITRGTNKYAPKRKGIYIYTSIFTPMDGSIRFDKPYLFLSQCMCIFIYFVDET